MFRYIEGNSLVHKINSTFKLIFLMFLSISIFTYKDSYYLIYVSIFVVLLMISTKISITKYFKSLTRTFIYILFIFILNTIISDVEYSLMISYRIFLMLVYTLIFSITTKTSDLSKAITTVLTPLKLFRVNTKDIGIMIAICVNFIPILSREFRNIKEAQMSKGYMPRIRNIKKYLVCIFIPFISNCFKKVDEISIALYAKGYK